MLSPSEGLDGVVLGDRVLPFIEYCTDIYICSTALATFTRVLYGYLPLLNCLGSFQIYSMPVFAVHQRGTGLLGGLTMFVTFSYP